MASPRARAGRTSQTTGFVRTVTARRARFTWSSTTRTRSRIEGTAMANVIIGTGSYLPERVVTNDEIEAAVVDYDRKTARGASLDEWSRRKHGAITRHKA